MRRWVIAAVVFVALAAAGTAIVYSARDDRSCRGSYTYGVNGGHCNGDRERRAAPATQGTTELNSPPYTRGVHVDHTYVYSLYTHCGIDKAQIDGTWWRASPPQDDANGNPPSGWGSSATGLLAIVDRNKAVFSANGLAVTYVRDKLPRLFCN